jgi:hypothetical protein
MVMTCLKRFFLIIACCLAGYSHALADVVYTWVDPGRVTHFSQTPPPDPGVPSRRIELAPLPPPPEYDDYYSVIRQAERMEKRRLESEKLEAERLRAEAEARRARMEAEAAAQPPETYPDDNTVYLPFYPYYPGHGPGHSKKPWRSGNRPGGPGYRPDKPGHWPRQPHTRPAHRFRQAPHRTSSAIPPRP